MTALALAVKGILGVQEALSRPELMAGLAFLHRLTLLPKVAPPLVIMMTLFAGDQRLGVAPVAEFDRGFFPLWLLNIEPTFVRGLGRPPRSPGSQSPQQRHGQDPPASPSHG
jgi:hypothetical protein